MRYKLMLSVLVFCASMAFAQDGILSGKVMGPDGEVVPGANVVLAGDAIVDMDVAPPSALKEFHRIYTLVRAFRRD